MPGRVLDNTRILAVDDEPDILEILEEELAEFENLIFDKATDYETGYHLLRSWTYDLVILDIMGVRGFDLLNAAVSLRFPTVMLTAHALSVDALKKSIKMGARAYIPKEKMSEVVSFLEDVLLLEDQPGWRRLFERLGGFFNAQFGPDWRKGEEAFWRAVESGNYQSEPIILRK